MVTTRIALTMASLLLIMCILRTIWLISSVKRGIIKIDGEIYKCKQWDMTPRNKEKNK